MDADLRHLGEIKENRPFRLKPLLVGTYNIMTVASADVSILAKTTISASGATRRKNMTGAKERVLDMRRDEGHTWMSKVSSNPSEK